VFSEDVVFLALCVPMFVNDYLAHQRASCRVGEGKIGRTAFAP
jgi:hypothetical protein